MAWNRSPVLLAELPEFGKDMFLEGIALFFEVGKGEADKNAKCFTSLRYRVENPHLFSCSYCSVTGNVNNYNGLPHGIPMFLVSQNRNKLLNEFNRDTVDVLLPDTCINWDKKHGKLAFLDYHQ